MIRRIPLTATDVERVFRKTRLELVHQRGIHRFWGSPIDNNVLTTVPYHDGPLPHSLIASIVKDVGLTETRFRGLL